MDSLLFVFQVDYCRRRAIVKDAETRGTMKRATATGQRPSRRTDSPRILW